MRHRPKRVVHAAALLAIAAQEEPARKAHLQELSGLDDFAFGRALGLLRVRGYVRFEGGQVYVTDKGRAELDPDPAAA